MNRFSRCLAVILLSGAACVAAAPTAGAACTDSVTSKSRFTRGGSFSATYNVCKAGKVVVGLVALEDAHKGNLALRRTVNVTEPGKGVATSTIGALATGRYRLVLIAPSGRHVRGHVVRVVQRTS
jgi:flavoprotein